MNFHFVKTEWLSSWELSVTPSRFRNSFDSIKSFLSDESAGNLRNFNTTAEANCQCFILNTTSCQQTETLIYTFASEIHKCKTLFNTRILLFKKEKHESQTLDEWKGRKTPEITRPHSPEACSFFVHFALMINKDFSFEPRGQRGRERARNSMAPLYAPNRIPRAAQHTRASIWKIKCAPPAPDPPPSTRSLRVMHTSF